MRRRSWFGGSILVCRVGPGWGCGRTGSFGTRTQRKPNVRSSNDSFSGQHQQCIRPGADFARVDVGGPVFAAADEVRTVGTERDVINGVIVRVDDGEQAARAGLPQSNGKILAGSGDEPFIRT